MTRRFPPPARNEVAVTVARRQSHPARRAVQDGRRSVEADIALARRALDRLADSVTEDCIEALDAVMERADLPRSVGADAMRPVVWDFVRQRLLDALKERVAETQPSLVADLKVSTTRETLIQLLVEFDRD